MQPDFDSRGVTRPLSAFLRLAMLGCPARRARGQLAAGACAPEPVWDRCGSSSAGACAWRRRCRAGVGGACWRVCARLPLARLRGSAPRRRFRKVIGGTNRGAAARSDQKYFYISDTGARKSFADISLLLLHVRSPHYTNVYELHRVYSQTLLACTDRL